MRVVTSISAEMRAQYGGECVEESTYGEGTFDADRARADRRFIYDFPEIATIVEGRIHGHQASWRRTLKVNASFGIDVDVLNVFRSKAAGTYERTYELYVEFYPKPQPRQLSVQ